MPVWLIIYNSTRYIARMRYSYSLRNRAENKQLKFSLPWRVHTQKLQNKINIPRIWDDRMVQNFYTYYNTGSRTFSCSVAFANLFSKFCKFQAHSYNLVNNSIYLLFKRFSLTVQNLLLTIKFKNTYELD